MINKRDFIILYTKLCEAYGKEFSEGQAIVYLENLQKLDKEALEKSIRYCLQECKFFPTIADIIDKLPRTYHRSRKAFPLDKVPMPEETRKKYKNIGKKI